MASKTIMAHITGEQHLDGLLDVLSVLAARLKAHVVGVVHLTDQTLGAITNQDRATLAEREALLRGRFEGSARECGYSTEWRRVENRATLAALAQAHAADLVVAGQFNTEPQNQETTSTLELFLIGAGRPVLLTPMRLKSNFQCERILIGWNGSQACTRAVADALPILKTARHLKILHLKKSGEHRHSQLISGRRLAASLARHAIQADAEEIELPISDPGAAILSAVKAENADLLVMGCDGYLRLQEFVPGSATRHVLKRMTVPVLMSH